MRAARPPGTDELPGWLFGALLGGAIGLALAWGMILREYVAALP